MTGRIYAETGVFFLQSAFLKYLASKRVCALLEKTKIFDLRVALC